MLTPYTADQNRALQLPGFLRNSSFGSAPMKFFRSLHTAVCLRGHFPCSGATSHSLSGFACRSQTKNGASLGTGERPQLVLVLFIAGQFSESHPLFLICQILTFLRFQRVGSPQFPNLSDRRSR
jgi:hypothetical protein